MCGKKNSSQGLSETVVKQFRESEKDVTATDWKNYCEHVVKIQNEYMDIENWRKSKP